MPAELDILRRLPETNAIKLVLNEKTAAYILASICLILAVGMVAGWLMNGSLHTTLAKSGKRAQGSVIAANSRSIATGKTARMQERMLSVIYMVDLKMYSKDFRVTEKGLDEHPQGSKVEVIYDPSDPNQSVLGGDFGLESAGTAWIGGIIFAVLAIGLFWYAIRKKPQAAVQT